MDEVEQPNVISTEGRGPNTIYTLKAGDRTWKVQSKAKLPEGAFARWRQHQAREGMRKIRAAADIKPKPVAQPESDELQSPGEASAGMKPSENAAAAQDQQQLDKAAKRAQNLVTCKVCLCEEVKKLVIPCGHLVFCSSCLDRWLSQNSAGQKCPVCRTEIKDHFGIFMIE